MDKAGGGDLRVWNCVFIFFFWGGANRTCTIVEFVGALVLIYHSTSFRGIGSMLGMLTGLESLPFEFRCGLWN